MMIRKNIVLLIIGIAAAVQSIGVFEIYAQDTNNQTGQVTEVSEKRAEMLHSLGVLYDIPDDETEDLSKEVSRAEYAKILVKYFNRPYSYTNLTEKPYVDVELTNEYALDIKTVKDYGYVYDARMLKFRPYDTVTINEAAIMLMRGLGYTYLSDKQALSSAGSVRILKDINKSGSEAAILDDIYLMLENALRVGLVEIEFKSGGTDYKASKDKTVLSEYYGLKKMRGIVTANSLTGLSEAAKNVKTDQIAVNGKAYALKYNKCNEYLGYNIDFYVTDDDNEKIIYAVPNDDNNITEINVENIESVNSTEICYSINDKKNKTVKLENNYDVIYNKKAYSNYGMLMNIIPEEGQLAAVDNDGNGKADILLITSYEYYMVKDLYSHDDDKRVYTEDNNILDLNYNNTDVEIRNSEGNIVTFAAIKKNSVLTVEQSKNTDGTKRIAVIISDKKVTGILTSKSDDTISIDKKEYPASKILSDSIDLGYEGTFYIAHNGKVVFYKEIGDTSWEVGLVYKIFTDKNDKKKFCISIYTPENNFIQYTMADKIRIEKNSQYKDGVQGWEKVKEELVNGEVIRYRLNNAGEIIRIEKADEGIKNSGEISYVNSQGLRLLGEGTKSFYYRNGIFDGKIVTDSDTLFYAVPPQDNWGDKESFYTNVSSILKSGIYDYSYSYRAYTYGDGEVAYANVVVLPDVWVDNVDIYNENPLYVIGKVSKVMFKDELYNQIVLYGKGEKTVYYCNDSILEKYDLQKNDIIQFEADSDKKIMAVRKILNADNGESVGSVIIPGKKHSNGTTPTKDVLYSGLICYGKVIHKNDKYIEYTYIGDTRYIGLMARCKYTMLEKDKSKNAVSVADYNDVSVGDNFVAMISSGEVKDMIILK